MNEVYFILLNQFADWEFAPLACAVNQFSGWTVKTVSLSRNPERSIGGLTVTPDCDIGGIDWHACKGLILIGGYAWRTPEARSVAPAVATALKDGAVVGAICDATTFLASTGALNNAAHTGNMISDLKLSANYTGEHLYKPEQAVRDGNIVTANGCAPLEFVKETLIALGLLNENEAGRWRNAFKNGLYEATADAMWWFEKIKQENGKA